MVHCPNCHRNSLDRDFCDHCNSALLASNALDLPASITLADGHVIDLTAFHGNWPADGTRPLHVRDRQRPRRLYALSRAWWRDLAPVIEARAKGSLPILAPIHIVPHGDGVFVVADALPSAASPLPDLASSNEAEIVERTFTACKILASAITILHDAGLVWLNFDPQAIESSDSRTQLTNLDLRLFPAGECPDTFQLSPAYSPPEICDFRDERIGPATDVFHVGMYAYYRLADLPRGFPGQGLEAFDFEIPQLRIYCPTLPPGVAPVIHRALARDPDDRYASVTEFLAAFEGAVNRMRRRRTPAPPFRWECGSATAIGRSHELAGLPNQDACTMLSLDRNRSLYIVADGVTTCSVGSGDLASQICVDVLAEVLPDLLRQAVTPTQIEQALDQGCARASETVLQRALSEGVPRGTDPAELMSSTVMIGYVHGHTLTLAWTGDSRAYLVGLFDPEQLTVDGDVRCVHLAHGAAPEEVRDLGPDALALFTCLGVGEPGPNGGLVPSAIRTRPRITHWPMLPRDVVVLATDGLVEEGVFLEPADLNRICLEVGVPMQDLTAALLGRPPVSMMELAQRMVEAACERHRDESIWEPYGCGDDVTCIVLQAVGSRQ